MVVTGWRAVFLCLLLIFAIWCLFHWIPQRKRKQRSLRTTCGFTGIILGSTSTFLLAYFYLYIQFTHRLIAHGMNLSIVVYSGELLALLGLLTASCGTGWISACGLFTSLAMAFQWARMGIVGPYRLVDHLMYVSLAVLASFVLLRRNSIEQEESETAQRR
jgi:hypothetical protein